jgi:hypothetical protein
MATHRDALGWCAAVFCALSVVVLALRASGERHSPFEGESTLRFHFGPSRSALGSVRGRIEDSSGAPIAAVHVEAWSGDGYARELSDDRGEFSVPCECGQSVTLEFSSATSFFSPSIVEVPCGTNPLIITKVRDIRTMEFACTVVDSRTAQPIVGAAVSFYTRLSQDSGHRFTTNNNGIAVGSYSFRPDTCILVQASGFKTAEGECELLDEASSERVSLKVSLEPGFRSTLWVRDWETEDGIEGVRASVKGMKIAVSDERGRMEVETSEPVSAVTLSAAGYPSKDLSHDMLLENGRHDWRLDLRIFVVDIAREE